MKDAILAYLHILGILTIFISLAIEALVLKPQMTRIDLKRLTTADAAYGIGAVVMLLTGLLRLFVIGKGSEYYLNHPLFIIKLSLFAIVGLLTIYPTIYFIRFSRQARNSGDANIPFPLWKKFKNIVYLELGLLLIIPLLANLVARGILF